METENQSPEEIAAAELEADKQRAAADTAAIEEKVARLKEHKETVARCIADLEKEGISEPALRRVRSYLASL